MKGAILTNASAADRSATDFYPTPPEATFAVARWMQLSGKTVWEPACGAGHMSRALEECGATVVSSELHVLRLGRPYRAACTRPWAVPAHMPVAD